MKNLLTRSGSASCQRIPESSTEMRTSGRPVVTCQALSTLAPRTPKSSCGLESIAASPVLPELSFQSSPKSFGSSGGSFCGRKA